MRTEIVRVCGICYQVGLSEGAMGEPEIVKVDLLGEDGLRASCSHFAANWFDLLAEDYVEAIVMAVEDGNFVQTI